MLTPCPFQIPVLDCIYLLGLPDVNWQTVWIDPVPTRDDTQFLIAPGPGEPPGGLG